jgi:hypothetical protein
MSWNWMESTRASEIRPMKVQKMRKNACDLERPMTPLKLFWSGGVVGVGGWVGG